MFAAIVCVVDGVTFAVPRAQSTVWAVPVPNVTLSMCTGYGGAPHEPPPTVAYSAAILRKA